MWQAITIIEAQEMLKNITVAQVPYFKNKKDFDKLHRSLSRQAFPETFKENKKFNSNDLAKALGGL